MKRIILFVAIAAMTMVSSADAQLIITGVIDGDLPGGNPKAIVLTATADIADLAIYGVGSANNGGGTDDEEFTLSGSATSGDQILVVGNEVSVDFFTNCFTGLTILQDGAANINGDDAVELFQNGAVIDTYGVIDVDGIDDDGVAESWAYRDGFAVRTGGTAGAFDQANYNSQNLALDGLDPEPDVSQDDHKSALATAFGFTPSDGGPAILLGDANCDGIVNFLDISPFIQFLSSGDFKAEADINEDGFITFADISGFISILSTS